ncbi:MAG: hypothetical protein ACXVJO_00570 [Thermoanaerobaculia bacterium]
MLRTSRSQSSALRNTWRGIPRPQAATHNHPDDEHRFFHEVAKSLARSDEVLALGPSTAKLHFRDYVLAHVSTLRFKIAGVETIDHPTDKQLIAYVRQYFLSAAGGARPDQQSRRSSGGRRQC